MAHAKAKLVDLSPDSIRPNPENPRLIFREEDMNVLLNSIDSVGIKVALTVYEERNSYRILDGERRWRCARKLNLGFVPAIVQPKPKKLENLLTMFNIHNVRVDWDMIATATKLGDVRSLLEREGKDSSVNDLASLTGISQSMVRNCLELLELPKKHQNLLLTEAAKPKSEQKITPDLFIEILKSRRVIKSYTPEVFDDITPGKYLDTMVKKYRAGTAKSVTSFRNISKIARAERAGSSKAKAIPVLRALVKDETYTIDEAFEDSVKLAYEERDITSRTNALLTRLRAVKSKSKLSIATQKLLQKLRDRINELIGG